MSVFLTKFEVFGSAVNTVSFVNIIFSIETAWYGEKGELTFLAGWGGMMISRELFFIHLNVINIRYTLLFENLKEGILKIILTLFQMGQQITRAKKVYENCQRFLAY